MTIDFTKITGVNYDAVSKHHVVVGDGVGTGFSVQSVLDVLQAGVRNIVDDRARLIERTTLFLPQKGEGELSETVITAEIKALDEKIQNLTPKLNQLGEFLRAFKAQKDSNTSLLGRVVATTTKESRETTSSVIRRIDSLSEMLTEVVTTLGEIRTDLQLRSLRLPPRK